MSRWWKRLAVPLAAVLVATGCVSAGGDGGRTPPPGLAAYYDQDLDWSGCGNKFQCAELQVPLDYAKPHGKRIKLSVIRLRTSGDRIGSLVINPGGPGGSGVDYARAADNVLSPDLLRRFDVVGFDPRGVGRSAPVHCLSAKQMTRYLNGDPTPDDAQDRARLKKSARMFDDGCIDRSDDLLKHISTAESARDMDILRAALGEKKLTYLGKSYGTYLGALYAQRFPKRVRSLVLDGAVDPKVTGLPMVLGQARGFATALHNFAADCLRRTTCPLGHGSDAAAGIARLKKLLADADRTPIPVPRSSRDVTEATATYGVVSALYSESSWSYLREALTGARHGDGAGLQTLADSLVGRKPGGGYDNSIAALSAIGCIDQPWPRGESAYRKAAARVVKKAPVLGPEMVWTSLPCAYWPVKSPAKARAIHAPGAPPLLVVGTTADPATPYAWAESLAGQLDSGVLLTRKGNGHTGYLMGNSCVDTAVDRYLIDGTPPKDGTRCSG